MIQTKHILLFILSGIFASYTFAGPRSRQQALAIAAEKANQLGITMTDASNRHRVAATTANADSQAAYYIFNNGNDQGWTIVSGDDRMDAIIGYSDEGSLDEDNLPEPLTTILGLVDAKVKGLAADTTTTTTAKAPRKAAQSTASAIGPLLTTKWDQYEPYYNLTPTSDGSQCATSCVVTAFAQILYYLYHTQDGQATTTFANSIPAYTTDKGVAGSAVAGPRTYNWADMLPDYASVSYTDEQATAVATLMRDLGTALRTNYAVGASTAAAKNPLYYGPTYFGIESSGLSFYGLIESTDEWHTIIDKELNTYHPVEVNGNGHAFVCDGRDASGEYYHFNFGYSGRGNGFYSFDAIQGYNTSGSMRYITGIRLGSPLTPATAKEKLQIKYNSALATSALEPVGTVPGQYQQKYYDALQTLLTAAKIALDSDCAGMTDDEVVALGEQVSEAEQMMTEHRMPYRDGKYRIRTYANYSMSNGAMYSSGSAVRWGNVNTSSSAYEWNVRYDESKNGYTIQNVASNRYITSISAGGPAALSDNSTIACEIWPTNRLKDTDKYNVSIRPMCSGYRDDNDHYFYRNSYDLIGWEPYNDAAMWVMEDIIVTPLSSLQYDEIQMQTGATATNAFECESPGAVTYTSSNPDVVTVDGEGHLAAMGRGTATVTIDVAATDVYYGISKTYTVKVANQFPTITFDSSDVSVMVETTSSNPAKTQSDGKVTYTSSDEGIATVDEQGVVKGVSVGTTVITATSAATEQYADASASYTVTVSKNPDVENELSSLKASAQKLYTRAELQFVQNKIKTAGYVPTEIESSLNDMGLLITASGTCATRARINALQTAMDRFMNSVPKGTSVKVDGIIPSYVTTQLNADSGIASMDLTGATRIFGQFVLRDDCAVTTGEGGVQLTSVAYSFGSANQWRTVCLPFALTGNDNIKYYELKQVSGDVMQFSEVDNVAANTPAVCRPQTDGYTWTMTNTTPFALITSAAGTVPPVQGLALIGTYRSLAGVTGYYESGNTFDSITSTTAIQPYHAYYEVQGTAGSFETYKIQIYDPTSIHSLSADSASDDAIYSPQGLRLSKAVKGLNIVNGKKVIVK